MTATERIELWKHELDLKNWKYNVLKNGNTIVYDTTDGATTFITALADFTDISVRGIGHISEDQYGHMMFAINRFNGRILPVHRFLSMMMTTYLLDPYASTRIFHLTT